MIALGFTKEQVERRAEIFADTQELYQENLANRKLLLEDRRKNKIILDGAFDAYLARLKKENPMMYSNCEIVARHEEKEAEIIDNADQAKWEIVQKIRPYQRKAEDNLLTDEEKVTYEKLKQEKKVIDKNFNKACDDALAANEERLKANLITEEHFRARFSQINSGDFSYHAMNSKYEQMRQPAVGDYTRFNEHAKNGQLLTAESAQLLTAEELCKICEEPIPEGVDPKAVGDYAFHLKREAVTKKAQEWVEENIANNQKKDIYMKERTKEFDIIFERQMESLKQTNRAEYDKRIAISRQERLEGEQLLAFEKKVIAGTQKMTSLLYKQNENLLTAEEQVELDQLFKEQRALNAQASLLSEGVKQAAEQRFARGEISQLHYDHRISQLTTLDFSYHLMETPLEQLRQPTLGDMERYKLTTEDIRMMSTKDLVAKTESRLPDVPEDEKGPFYDEVNQKEAKAEIAKQLKNFETQEKLLAIETKARTKEMNVIYNAQMKKLKSWSREHYNKRMAIEREEARENRLLIEAENETKKLDKALIPYLEKEKRNILTPQEATELEDLRMQLSDANHYLTDLSEEIVSINEQRLANGEITQHHCDVRSSQIYTRDFTYHVMDVLEDQLRQPSQSDFDRLKLTYDDIKADTVQELFVKRGAEMPRELSNDHGPLEKEVRERQAKDAAKLYVEETKKQLASEAKEMKEHKSILDAEYKNYMKSLKTTNRIAYDKRVAVDKMEAREEKAVQKAEAKSEKYLMQLAIYKEKEKRDLLSDREKRKYEKLNKDYRENEEHIVQLNDDMEKANKQRYEDGLISKDHYDTRNHQIETGDYSFHPMENYPDQLRQQSILNKDKYGIDARMAVTASIDELQTKITKVLANIPKPQPVVNHDRVRVNVVADAIKKPAVAKSVDPAVKAPTTPTVAPPVVTNSSSGDSGK